MRLDDVKAIVNLIVGIGIETIICGAIKTVLPNSKGLSKACVSIASLAIVAAITDATQTTTDSVVDEAANAIGILQTAFSGSEENTYE